MVTRVRGRPRGANSAARQSLRGRPARVSRRTVAAMNRRAVDDERSAGSFLWEGTVSIELSQSTNPDEPNGAAMWALRAPVPMPRPPVLPGPKLPGGPEVKPLPLPMPEWLKKALAVDDETTWKENAAHVLTAKAALEAYDLSVGKAFFNERWSRRAFQREVKKRLLDWKHRKTVIGWEPPAAGAKRVRTKEVGKAIWQRS